MSRIRVGVVRGGPSSEYVVSLKTGENILRHLNKSKYAPRDILVTTRGDWYMDGVRTTLANIAEQVDVVWNAMHGTFGEDGKAQQLFESFNIPYTGSGVMPSAVGMNKALAKERFKEAGILTPIGVTIEAGDVFSEIAEQFAHEGQFPLIVKPASGGSSVATAVVENAEELKNALMEASKYGDVLVEEYIVGKEATVCVIDSGNPEEHYVLFPIEIAPPENHFFDYETKYGNDTADAEICPGRFSLATHTALRDAAIAAHRAVGARHYSRSDFIITPKGIHILEINTLPGLTKASLFPKALAKGGIQFPEFLDHIIDLSLRQ